MCLYCMKFWKGQHKLVLVLILVFIVPVSHSVFFCDDRESLFHDRHFYTLSSGTSIWIIKWRFSCRSWYNDQNFQQSLRLSQSDIILKCLSSIMLLAALITHGHDCAASSCSCCSKLKVLIVLFISLNKTWLHTFSSILPRQLTWQWERGLHIIWHSSDIVVVFDGENGNGQSKFMVNEKGHSLSVAHNVIACFQGILEICMTNQNFI